MTVTEAALYLGISKERVLQFIHEGRLAALRFGRTWALYERDLAEFKQIPRRPGNPKLRKPEPEAA